MRLLTDLLVHIETLRANKQFSALRAEETSGVGAVKQDVARTQSTVEAMHGTLGQVVERLTAIEKDIRNDDAAHAAAESDVLEVTQPVGNAAAFNRCPRSSASAGGHIDGGYAVVDLGGPFARRFGAGGSLYRYRRQASRRSKACLQPDEPLEPGSGPPRARP